MSPDGSPAGPPAELLVWFVVRQMDARGDEELDGLINAMLCSAYPTPLAQNQ